jgi:hypothetical protein
VAAAHLTTPRRVPARAPRRRSTALRLLCRPPDGSRPRAVHDAQSTRVLVGTRRRHEAGPLRRAYGSARESLGPRLAQLRRWLSAGMAWSAISPWNGPSSPRIRPPLLYEMSGPGDRMRRRWFARSHRTVRPGLPKLPGDGLPVVPPASAPGAGSDSRRTTTWSRTSRARSAELRRAGRDAPRRGVPGWGGSCPGWSTSPGLMREARRTGAGRGQTADRAEVLDADAPSGERCGPPGSARSSPAPRPTSPSSRSRAAVARRWTTSLRAGPRREPPDRRDRARRGGAALPADRVRRLVAVTPPGRGRVAPTRHGRVALQDSQRVPADDTPSAASGPTRRSDDATRRIATVLEQAEPPRGLA